MINSIQHFQQDGMKKLVKIFEYVTGNVAVQKAKMGAEIRQKCTLDTSQGYAKVS